MTLQFAQAKYRNLELAMRFNKLCISSHDDGVVVVLSGDVPLTQVDTLQALIQACAMANNLALLTIDFEDPARAMAVSCAMPMDHQVHGDHRAQRCR